MMNPTQCRDAWKAVTTCYNETIERNNPEVTMKKIIETLGLVVTKEVFATVSAIKKHDGRIYGKNREYMDSIPVNPDSTKWESGNPMLYAGLDEIHTAHIDNMITELRKCEKQMLEAEAKAKEQEKAFKALARKYGFTTGTSKKPLRAINLCAKNTDGNATVWLSMIPCKETLQIRGNTDHLNLWFCDTRPDLIPEKLTAFVRELNVVLEMEVPVLLKQIVDPEDWQEIAGVCDAYEDTRYTAEPLYVALFNRTGNKTDLQKLAQEYSADVICDALVFWDKTGQEVSDLMERDGWDYNYAKTYKEAFDKSSIVGK